MLKKVLSFLIVGILSFNMTVIAYADETTTPEKTTVSTIVGVEDAVAGADGNSTGTGTNTTKPPTTSISEVTDENGEVVTDENGNAVTTIIEIEPEEAGDVTTTPSNIMEGQYSTRDLSEDELIALDRIKKELENEKANQFQSGFATITAIVGILVIIYTVVILLAFLLDKLNILPDVDIIKYVTFGKSITVRDEDDLEYMKQQKEQVFLMTNKNAIINTLIGIGAGALLMNVDGLIYVVNYIYQTLSNLG